MKQIKLAETGMHDLFTLATPAERAAFVKGAFAAALVSAKQPQDVLSTLAEVLSTVYLAQAMKVRIREHGLPAGWLSNISADDMDAARQGHIAIAASMSPFGGDAGDRERMSAALDLVDALIAERESQHGKRSFTLEEVLAGFAKETAGPPPAPAPARGFSWD